MTRLFSHIQRIPCQTIDFQPRQRLRRIIRLVDCPAVVVVVVVDDRTSRSAVHHCARDAVQHCGNDSADRLPSCRDHGLDVVQRRPNRVHDALPAAGHALANLR